MDSDDLHRQGSDSEGPGPPAKCIEGLPVEIQRQIMLCIPSLASLGAITRASPVFYSLFQSEPKNFIANCLILGLGDAFLDASTAQAAMQDDFQRQRADAMRDHRELGVVWPFLESYRKRVAELPCNAWIHSISLPEAVQMARFHTSTVEPLVEQYASWALGNIGTPVAPAALSRTETMRIQRAMYRFQIVCNVFGNRIKHDSLSSHRAQSLGCLRFLSGYEPWEIEEILCINAFFQEQYEGKLAETSYDLIPRRDSLSSHPLFGEREQEIDFEEARTREHYRNFLVSQGLPLLLDVLRTAGREGLVRVFRANLHWHAFDTWLDDITGNTNMHERWEQSYSERDAAQDEGRAMPFRGDDLGGDNDNDGGDRPGSPPLAWVLIWAGTYSNLFGVFIPRTLRRWGYIMWDAARLEETGAKDVLMREWFEMWQGGDYRESLRAWGNHRA